MKIKQIMFGLFKRTKLEKWELDLIVNVTSSLPVQYEYLCNQVKDGLIRNVLLESSDVPGYISFGFNNNVYKKYYKPREQGFKIKNIQVFDNRLSSYIALTLYVSGAVLIGYSFDGVKKHNIDPKKIIVNSFIIEMFDDFDFETISSLLSKEEVKYINPSHVYKLVLFGQDIFHLKDLEDGDFIGIDQQNNIYKVTHDPYELNPILRADLLSILQQEEV